MKILILFVFTSIHLILPAQNMVPDPGFEIARRMPSKNNNGIFCTKHWSCAGQGAGDYYHRDGDRHAGVPRNIFGRQRPHSGEAYGGLCINRKLKEYLTTRLTDTLIKDQEYLVEFYISRADWSIGAVKEFGALFTDKMRFGFGSAGIDLAPQVDHRKGLGFRNKWKWIKLSGVYRAEGSETALIIGHFTGGRKKFRGIAHYYIDDVSVTPLEIITPEVTIQVTEEVEAVKEFSPPAGEAIRLDHIFFATNKSELLPPSFPELDKLAGFLSENNVSITITGHTDKTGDEKKNLLLSEARARSVAGYLAAMGIDQTRIKYEGSGSAKPVASNSTEEGKQKNRRVEFTIHK